MAKWFRSEPMEYISLIVNEDAAHDCLADLGKLGAIQFTDVSEPALALALAWLTVITCSIETILFYVIVILTPSPPLVL